jgi:RNA polymerase sigma-70 factor (ECF subfamily)
VEPLAVVDDPRQNVRQSQFEGLFATFYPPVLAYARRRSGPDVAVDVAAATFEVAWRRLEEVPPDPLPWLYGVARRMLANTRRGDERRQRLTDRVYLLPHPDTADAVAEASIAGRALARLRPDDREVLMLVAWEGLDAEAAARSLGISQSAFGVRLHRARRRLENDLKKEQS